jgi:hypothetical protein
MPPNYPKFKIETKPFLCPVLGESVFLKLTWLLRPNYPDMVTQFACSGCSRCEIGVEEGKCPHPSQKKSY